MSVKTIASGFKNRLSRRTVLKGTGLAAVAGLAGCEQADVHRDRIPIPTFESIGVRPIINCYGTYTILSGSLLLPEVRKAMMEASKRFVQIDELMKGVGRRLAELTGAEWGCVTSSCTAALAAAAAGCITGMDPEKMRILPDTSGLKNEVLVPSNQVHSYLSGIRIVGGKLIVVETLEEMEAAINERSVMMALTGSGFARGRGMPLEGIVALSKKYNVPIVVDCAAENLTVPNVYLEQGVDMVAHSGGKPIRGPQASGLLLGRKDLIRSAYQNMSPHHSIGRAMKVGKEEIMGLLTAVDCWVNGRDHDAEWKEWERRLTVISDKVIQIPTVTTRIDQSTEGYFSVADHQPRLFIKWDRNSVSISPEQAQKQLVDGEPRIAIPGADGGLVVNPWMMDTDEEIIVAQRLYEVLSARA